MRFPSLQSLAGEALPGFRRFPIAIVLAVKGVVIGDALDAPDRTFIIPKEDSSMVLGRDPLLLSWDVVVGRPPSG